MIPIKIIAKNLQFRRTKTTNFCLSPVDLNCAICGLKISNSDYIFICGDFQSNKVFHDFHFDNNHEKINWFIVFGQRHHQDWFCVFKKISEENFEKIENEIITLK